jgi:hypothetical protein
MKILKIIELEWIMKNRVLLDKDDYKQLQSYDLFNQYDNGELHQTFSKMVEVLGLVIDLHKKYTK